MHHPHHFVDGQTAMQTPYGFPPSIVSHQSGVRYTAQITAPMKYSQPSPRMDDDDNHKKESWMGGNRRWAKFVTKGSAFASEHSRELICWGVLLGFVLTGYAFFSDGSFSAILTLSSVFQCFAFILLLTKVRMQLSTVGVSLRSLRLYLLSLLSRLSSTLFFIGYLPVDRTGNWIYQLTEIGSVVLLLALLYSARRTRDSEASRVSAKHDTCHTIGPVVLLLVLAYFVHPNLNRWDPADIAWTFALYVETVAMVPQIFLMGKSSGEVEVFTSHYIASMGISKMFGLVFWVFSYHELASRDGGNVAGWTVLCAYGIQAVLFADFLYYYVKAVRMGRSLIINGI